MAQAEAFTNQANYGILPQPYPFMVRFTPASDSFYIGLIWSLINQVCRHRKNSYGKELSDKLNSVAMDSINVPGSSQYYEQTKHLSTFLQAALNQDIVQFQSYIMPYVNFFMYFGRSILSSICFKKGFNPEVRSCLSPGFTIDESKIFPAISELLNVAIEVFYNPNDCRIYCEGKPVPSRILISLAIISAEKEVAVACHYQNDSYTATLDQQLLNSHPFLYIKPIQKIVSNPANNYLVHQNSLPNNDAAVTELLKNQMKIFCELGWILSKKQASAIKKLMKKLPEKSEYADYKKPLLKKLKQSSCEHSQKDFYAFACGKNHCVECFKDEIGLKSLQSHQIFCSCRKQLTNEEIRYFFEIKPQQSNERSIDAKFQNQARPNSGNQIPFITPSGPPSAPIFSNPQGGTGILGPPSGSNIIFSPSFSQPSTTSIEKPSGLPQMSPGMSGPLQMPPGIPGPPQIPPGIPGPPQMPLGLSSSPQISSGFPAIPSTMSTPFNSTSGLPSMPIPNVRPGQDAPGLPPSLPPNLPVLNNSAAISGFTSSTLPRIKFCAKCNMPVNTSNLEERNGKFYHKNC